VRGLLTVAYGLESLATFVLLQSTQNVSDLCPACASIQAHALELPALSITAIVALYQLSGLPLLFRVRAAQFGRPDILHFSHTGPFDGYVAQDIGAVEAVDVRLDCGTLVGLARSPSLRFGNSAQLRHRCALYKHQNLNINDSTSIRYDDFN